jgi:transcriptional regulator with XRE-family HTH domain
LPRPRISSREFVRRLAVEGSLQVKAAVSQRSPDPIDVLVGHNIRIHRIDQGLTQTDLAKRIGVTFQQVQKYEQGMNRVGGGRLFKIAEVLRLPISTFFEGPPSSRLKMEESPLKLLSEPHSLNMLKAFCQIENAEIRRLLIEVVERLASRRVGR